MDRITFKETWPRVGGLLEGDLWLDGNARADEEYRLRIVCQAEGRETFAQEQRSQAVSDPGGRRVPFRFDIPSSVPPTTILDIVHGQVVWPSEDRYEWRLEYEGRFTLSTRKSVPIHLGAVQGPAKPGSVAHKLEAAATPERGRAKD